MSRTAARACGAVVSGEASVDPLNGWFWPFMGGEDPTEVFPFNSSGPRGRLPVSMSHRDFFRLYWNIKKLKVTYDYDNGLGLLDSGSFFLERGEEEKDLIAPPETSPYSLFEGSSIGGGGAVNAGRVYFNYSQINHGTSLMNLCMYLQLGSVTVYTFDPALGADTQVAAGPTFMGYDMPMYSPSPFTTITCTVEPVEFFGYDGVFDTVTGAQLIPGITVGL